MSAGSTSRDLPLEKTVSLKVPRKIHKAEREKLKRDQLNDLFMDLGSAVEPNNRLSNGKASILCDTTRLLRELLVQVDNLKKEKTTLLTESHYVTVEKTELEDETALLRSEVEKLRNDIKERMYPGPTWNNQANIYLTQPQIPNSYPKDLPPSLEPTLQPSLGFGPFFTFPVCHDNQENHSSDNTRSIPCSVVRKPYPRYPTTADSWPLQRLSKLPRDEEREPTINLSISVSQDIEFDRDLGS